MSVTTASLLPDPPRRRNGEELLARSVAQYLRWALPDEAISFHIPNGGQRHSKAAARLVGMGLRAGIPDLCIVYRGRALFIELKTSSGSLSAVQRQVIRRLIYCGAEVMVCRSVDEVERSLREACVPLRAAAA